MTNDRDKIGPLCLLQDDYIDERQKTKKKANDKKVKTKDKRKRQR